MDKKDSSIKLWLVNGFLGAGKTTAVMRASQLLAGNGIVAGVVTNDQGDQLVDTQLVNSKGIPSAEVVNGCFCCNYHDLLAAATGLVERHDTSVIFAESVGSCTDLVATIVKPLNVSPRGKRLFDTVITIVADAVLLPSMFRGSMLFDKDIVYIYHKQLEEADIILLSRSDLVPGERMKEMIQQVLERYPGRIVIPVNKFDDEGYNIWIGALESFAGGDRTSLDIDYDTYGAGEAALAWLDHSVSIYDPTGSAAKLSELLCERIADTVIRNKWPIGHLKFFLADENFPRSISFTAISQSSAIQMLNSKTQEKQNQEVLINARIEADPRELKRIVDDIITVFEKENNCRITRGVQKSFKPGYPMPVHRIC